MRRAAAALAAVCALAAAAPAAAQARERFDTRVFALVGHPGYPAMAYVAPNGRVYEGTYTNSAAKTAPSRVFEYSGEGQLLRSWTVRGQELGGEQGVQVATMGASGRLYLLDKHPARVIRLDRRTGEQRTYATFPAGVVPNYATWVPGGALLVTDYEGGKVWRVPPGGGAATVWLDAPGLRGGPFGTTQITLLADRATVLVGQQSTAGLQAGNPATGRVFQQAIGADGRPAGPLQTVWESPPLCGPDGFAVAASGTLYIACLVTNQLQVVGADGTTREAFPAAPLTGANGSPVPFDSPSSVRFLGTRLIVAQQSFVAGDPAHQAILDVEAGERGLAEYIAPAKRKPHKHKRKRRRPPRTP